MSNEIKLYVIDHLYPVNVRPAIAKRDLPQNALKCLPLMIAAQRGYEILINESFSITWNGGPNDEDTVIEWDDPTIPKDRCAPTKRKPAWSNGGNGFFSFHTGIVLRTPVGVNTYMSGPPNLIIPGVQPMTAVVETDWNITHISMNYKLTDPGRTVHFNKGDPFCIFFPIERKYEEKFTVTMDLLGNNPNELDTFLKFQKAMKETDHEARKGAYRKGMYHFGEQCPVDHQKKLSVKEVDQCPHHGSINNEQD